MREIKFRAWDKHENKFIQDWQDDQMVGFEGFDGGNWADIMQYTGLKDKNGVEIYEGDIAEYGKLDGVSFYAICVFQDAKFQWKVYDPDGVYMDYDFKNEFEDNWIEVIGNIYENTEFLS